MVSPSASPHRPITAFISSIPRALLALPAENHNVATIEYEPRISFCY